MCACVCLSESGVNSVCVTCSSVLVFISGASVQSIFFSRDVSLETLQGQEGKDGANATRLSPAERFQSPAAQKNKQNNEYCRGSCCRCTDFWESGVLRGASFPSEKTNVTGTRRFLSWKLLRIRTKIPEHAHKQ